MAAIAFAYYLPKALAGDLEGQYLPGQNKNTIGSYVGAGLVMAYGLWLAAPRGRLRRLLAGAILIEGLGLFASVSRGAILGTVVAIVVVSLVLRQRRFMTLAGVAVAAVAYLSTLGIDSNVDRRLAGSYDSSLVRQYSFEHALDKIADRPILGSGAGTYRDYIPEIPIVLPDPNNMFLLTWAELGIVGVAALVFLLFRFGRLLLATRRLPATSQATAAAAGGVALSLFVHFQVDVTWTRGTTSLAFAMIGLMLATHRLAGSVPAGSPSAQTDFETRPAAPRHGSLVHA
jgi:O-antigen ligase